MTVIASDLDPSQPQSSTASLTLTIIDINDNNPIFAQPIYYDNDIFENEGIFMIQVLASDRDVDMNSQLTYSIYSGNLDNTFVIGKRECVCDYQFVCT